MTSVLTGHIILTPTQPVGSGRPQRGSNPGPPHPESRALPTEDEDGEKIEKKKSHHCSTNNRAGDKNGQDQEGDGVADLSKHGINLSQIGACPKGSPSIKNW